MTSRRRQKPGTSPWVSLCSLLLFVSCSWGPTGGTTTGQVLYDSPPSIEEIWYDCSVDEDQWSFYVYTTGWTANGSLLMAMDQDYVEEHTIKSQEAAADGSYDYLGLTLNIEADWRNVYSGSSTAFLCNESTLNALSYRLVVYTPGTQDQADCRSWGADPWLFDSVEDAPACDAIWEEPDSGSADG